MANHPNRSCRPRYGSSKVREYLKARGDAERIRYNRNDDTWDVYGRMPNSIVTGWWYAGTTRELLSEINLTEKR